MDESKYIFEDDEFLLRPWNRYDLDDFARVMASPEVSLWYVNKEIPDHAVAKAALNALLKRSGIDWAVIWKKDPKNPVIVGSIGITGIISIHQYSGVKELRCGIDRNYWGQGIGTKVIKMIENICYDTFNSQALTVRFVEEDEQTRRMAEKLGYSFYIKKPAGNKVKNTFIKVRGTGSDH